MFGVFNKDNIAKSKGDNLKTKVHGDENRKDDPSKDADTNRKTRANNPGTRTNTNIRANKRTKTNNSSTRTNTNIEIDNSNKIIDNPNTITENSSIAANNLGIRIDINVKANIPGIVVSNKTYAKSLIFWYYAFFLLAFFSELVITSLCNIMACDPVR